MNDLAVKWQTLTNTTVAFGTEHKETKSVVAVGDVHRYFEKLYSHECVLSSPLGAHKIRERRPTINSCHLIEGGGNGPVLHRNSRSRTTVNVYIHVFVRVRVSECVCTRTLACVCVYRSYVCGRLYRRQSDSHCAGPSAHLASPSVTREPPSPPSTPRLRPRAGRNPVLARVLFARPHRGGE